MYTNTVTGQDMQRIRSCAREFVKNPAIIPVSYIIGGSKYRGIPKEFSPVVKKRFLDSNIIEYVMKGTAPETNISITAECLEYLDFPVVEWTLWMENVGSEDTPVISDLYSMDGILPGEEAKLIYSNGDTTSYDLYTESCICLKGNEHFAQHPDGGRSNDCALPYYRVLCENFGYNLSIGWPGQWQSEFNAAEGGFCFKAKQQYTNFYLKPGEAVRTPRITIMTFEGGAERGINMWRRWMLAHVVPKPNGKVIQPFISMSDHGPGVEHTLATEQQQIRAVDSFISSNFVADTLWIDAGWYPCKDANGTISWNFTGAFHADKDRFPNGLKPVSDKCHENGMKLLLWFEPERICLKAKTDEYPDHYVLQLKDDSVLGSVRLTGISRRLVDGMGLLNLADSECCDWLIDCIDNLIKEYGIDIYRQDFNFPPLNWWLQNDTQDRLGITENFYNQGYLRFWDEIRFRNPGLWINSVAGGGRRSDLETLRRSVPLHQSDYGFGQHPVHQAIMTYGFTWEPYCGTFAKSSDNADGEYNFETPYQAPLERSMFDNFMAHNAFAPEFSIVWDGPTTRCTAMPDGEFAKTEECRYYNKYKKIWQRAVPYTLDSDFYVLAMTNRTNQCWHIVQFHNEEKGEGILQAIRNTKAPEETYIAHLRQIEPEKTYVFESPEFERTVTVSGRDLLQKGFEISIPQRSAELWFYHEL